MSTFSIIIPLYNKEKSIISTIDSVLKQTISDYEIIVINDGSTDNSLEIVKQLSDKRILIKTIHNSGVSIARNTGVSMAESEYVVFLDADDYWYPNHLEKFDEMICKYPDVNWYANAYEIEHNKHLTLPMKSPIMNKGNNWSGIIEDFFVNSMYDCLAWTSAVCMKKSFFQDLGEFDLTLHNNQDTDLWIRAALKSPIIFSNTVTATYKIGTSNHISKRKTKDKTILDFDKYENEYPNNLSLKKYLDLNRYSVAIRLKKEGDYQRAQFYYNKINLKNLSHKQRFLLLQPRRILQLLFGTKNLMEKLNIRVRSN